MSLFAQRASLIDTENAFKLGPQIRKLEDAGHRVIKCNLGEPDFPLPSHVREEIKRQLDRDNTHYTDPQGLPSLRRAIARQVSETRGIAVDAERVVVFAGAKPPIGFCQQTYCDPGDEVIYPSPGFPIYESFTRYVGAVPRPLHLSEERGFAFGAQDLEPLLSARTKLVILNFPSNPTGGVAARDQLEEIAELLKRRAADGARVYSDEVYEHIVYDGEEHRSIATLPGMASRTIIVSGVSKSYSWTGGRIGWAVFPSSAEAQVFKNLNINYVSCLPGYNQEGAREAIESRESAAAIEGMVAAFEKRRNWLVPALNAIPGFHCQMPRGAFYAFPNVAGACEHLGAIGAWESLGDAVRRATSPSTLLQRFLLSRYQVATMDRPSFGRVGSEGRHHLRISFATGLDDLREGVARIARAVEDRAGFEAFVREEAFS
ncbi:MAG: aminotransferase class I/II-fold pyridoxal phosphate-dependent enzyme [Acidobacteriota bacterium]